MAHIQSKRGNFSAPACPEVDGDRVCDRVRPHLGVAPGLPRICARGIRRSPAKHYSALRNRRCRCQHTNGISQSATILGPDGTWTSYLARVATDVDLRGSLFAT